MLDFPVYALLTHVVTMSMLLMGGVERNIKSLFISFLIAIIVSFFILSDHEIYAYNFQSINPSEGLLGQMSMLYGEPLYLLINYAMRGYTDDFLLVSVILVFVALIIKMYFLQRWAGAYTVAFIFYISILFYPDSYLLRSTLASSVALIGIWAVFNKRPAYQFYIPVIAASSIHLSALTLFPIWFFRNLRISNSTAYIVVMIIFFLGVFGLGHYLVSMILSYINNESLLASKLLDYQLSIYAESSGLVRGSVLLYFAIVSAFIFYKKTISQYFPHADFVLVLCLYSLFFLVAMSDFVILADRLFRMIAIFFAVAVGYLACCFRGGDSYMVKAWLMLILNILPYFMTPWDIQLRNWIA